MNVKNNSTKSKTVFLFLMASVFLLLLCVYLVRTKSFQSKSEETNIVSTHDENLIKTKSAPSDAEFLEAEKDTARLASAKLAQSAAINNISNSALIASYENSFISGNSLNSKKIYSTIESDNQFMTAMSKLKSEALQDPDTLELTRRYNEAINSSQMNDKNIKLNEFVCGSNICIGSLHETAPTSNWDAWLSSFEDNTNTPHFATIYTTIDLGHGQYEHRIVTSINSNIPGIATK